MRALTAYRRTPLDLAVVTGRAPLGDGAAPAPQWGHISGRPGLCPGLLSFLLWWVPAAHAGLVVVLAGRATVCSLSENRRRLPADRFLDVDYQELVAGPRATCARVWTFLGASDPDAAAHASVRAESSGRRARRPHRYSLQRYGLSRGVVESDLRGYERRLEEVRAASA